MVRWWLSFFALAACGGPPRPATTTPRVAPPEPSSPPWAPADALAFGDTLLVEQTGITLRLPSTSGAGCRVLVARSDGGLRDLDLALYAEDGTRLAADRAPDAHALVEVCGASPAFARIDARAGAGVATWVYFEGDAAPMRRELGVAGGRVEVDGWSALDATLRERGFTLRHERWSSRIDTGASWTAPFTLEAGRCATLAVRAEANVRLRLVSESARVESEVGALSALQLCSGASPVAGTLELEADASTELSFARWEGREVDVGGDEALWLGAR